MRTTMMKNRPLIFIPGWGFHASIWQEIAKQFSDNATHLLELPPLHDEALSINVITAKLIASCPNNAILVGWSLGGLIATALATNYPAHFSHLILLSSTPRFTADNNWAGISESQADKQLLAAMNDRKRYFHQFLGLACYPEKSSLMKNNLAPHLIGPDNNDLVPYLDILFNTDLRESFATISTPLLQMIAENDIVITKQQSLQSEALLPHKIEIIPNAGHMLISTHASQIVKNIRDFIC
jgi:pimeloyl-[acyl-carrier protein] methyl ester esterase